MIATDAEVPILSAPASICGRTSCVESRGCFDEVSTGFFGKLACLDDFVVRKQAGFEDYLDDGTVLGSGFHNRCDVVAYVIIIAGLENADIENHVNFARAVFASLFGLKRLGCACAGTERKTHDSGNLHIGASEVVRAARHITAVYADRVEVPLACFVTKLVNL